MNHAVFDVYEDRAGEWRWRLWSLRGRPRIIADSGEGYERPEGAEQGARWVQLNAPIAPIVRRSA